MVLDLRQLFELVDSRQPVDCELDLRGYELNGGHPFITPIQIKGIVKNVAGVVTLEYSVSFEMQLSCDRCLKEFKRCFSEDFYHILVNRLESEDDLYGDYIVVEDSLLNMDELVVSDVVLMLPNKNLCSDDCKGLCSQCGKDLNQGDCGCTEPKGDSRFDVLKQLLT